MFKVLGHVTTTIGSLSSTIVTVAEGLEASAQNLAITMAAATEAAAIEAIQELEALQATPKTLTKLEEMKANMFSSKGKNKPVAPVATTTP